MKRAFKSWWCSQWSKNILDECLLVYHAMHVGSPLRECEEHGAPLPTVKLGIWACNVNWPRDSLGNMMKLTESGVLKWVLLTRQCYDRCSHCLESAHQGVHWLAGQPRLKQPSCLVAATVNYETWSYRHFRIIHPFLHFLLKMGSMCLRPSLLLVLHTIASDLHHHLASLDREGVRTLSVVVFADPVSIRMTRYY